MTVRHLAALLALAACLAACAPPETTGPPAPTSAPSTSPSPAAAPSPDPDEVALEAEVAELARTIDAIRAALQETADGTDRSLEAIALLVADPASVLAGGAGPDGGVAPSPSPAAADGVEPSPGTADDTEPDGTDGAPAPLLPGPEVSREETIAYGDLLTDLLAVARGAGQAGEPVQRLLADPIAGDLGAWQQAPGDLLALVDRITTDTTLAAAEDDVLALDGEAVRALAWTTLGAKQPELSADAAERALAHLAIIELALERLG